MRCHAIALLLLSAAGPAAAAEFACLPLLTLRSADRVEAPAGWQATMRPQQHALAAAALFVGDPEKRVELQPEDRPQQRLAFWALSPEPEGYTLVCRYEGTEATLQARVPDGARRCELRTVSSNSRLMRGERLVTGATRVEAACR